jgi:hypothetical protein
MYVSKDLTMVRTAEGKNFLIAKNGEKFIVDISHPDYLAYENIYKTLVKCPPDIRAEKSETNALVKLLETLETVITAPTVENPDTLLKQGLKDLIKFFTEFQFEPNFRFVNSLALALLKSKTEALNYIIHYFELTDSPYTKEITQKTKSPEFKEIINKLSGVAPTKTINERFKLYYGSQGTGKTTIAMNETDGRCMVCNSSMLPADLMEDFVFVDGKATFQPSALWRSMVEGKPIVLDEINLLPFDSLRFLQTILDGKKEFLYKGHRVEIANGFCVIGTMNLTVNGMTYGLPEPLVDRCKEMKKFSLTADNLLSAIL